MSTDRFSYDLELHELHGYFHFLDDELHQELDLLDLDFLDDELHQELDLLDLEPQEDDLSGLSETQVSELQELLDILYRKIKEGLNLLTLVESQEVTDGRSTITEISIEEWAAEASDSLSISSFEPHWNTPIPTMLERLDLPQSRDAQKMQICPGGKYILFPGHCTISERPQPVEALQGANLPWNQCTSAREDPFFQHFRDFATQQGPCVPAKSRFFPTQEVPAS